MNGEAITADDLKDVNDATEFLWNLNQCEDDYLENFTKLASEPIAITTAMDIAGFVASVKKPRNLKISGTDERATIDLFVNGRLREKDILRHIPSQRIVESYLYGQIHFNSMDGLGVDPFTTSREGVVEDDENFLALLDYLKKDALTQIFDDWDRLRLARGEEGDDENTRKTKRDRKARDLYAAARAEFEPEDDAPNKDQVDEWLNTLRPDAAFNVSAYVDCYLSENLIRSYITANGIAMPKGVQDEADEWQKREAENNTKANISFSIRKDDDELMYLSMDALAVTAEGQKPGGQVQSLWNDAISYKPVRNVVGHTGRLTDPAKTHLSLTLENIKGRVKTLISSNEKAEDSEDSA